MGRGLGALEGFYIHIYSRTHATVEVHHCFLGILKINAFETENPCLGTIYLELVWGAVWGLLTPSQLEILFGDKFT